ncbi:MAG: PmoA family protein [Chthoniobacteraceae bacterium]
MRPHRILPVLLALASAASAAEPKPVPRMQAIPQPRDEVSFQRDGEEIARFHFAQDQRRPFVFPVIGPSGRSLTRMGHPHDPITHSHHNSVWFSHQFVGGVNFWGDDGGRISHLRVLRYEDADDVAFAETENAWLDKEGKPVLHDRRRISVKPLAGKEWLLLLDLQLEARAADVPITESAFGMLGVRMAKTIGVADGGGTIRNSEDGVDEAGCFRKPARWMDYSGPITPMAQEGIALFDHPQNPNHPVPFHCRNDGWMGASLTFASPLTVKKGEPLRLRYALYVHAGMPVPAKIEEQWKAFAASLWMEFSEKKK